MRIHKSKDKLDKEHVSTWSDKRYKVIDITEKFNQKRFKCFFLFICIKIVKILFNRSCNKTNNNFGFQRLNK